MEPRVYFFVMYQGAVWMVRIGGWRVFKKSLA